MVFFRVIEVEQVPLVVVVHDTELVLALNLPVTTAPETFAPLASRTASVTLAVHEVLDRILVGVMLPIQTTFSTVAAGTWL